MTKECSTLDPATFLPKVMDKALFSYEGTPTVLWVSLTHLSAKQNNSPDWELSMDSRSLAKEGANASSRKEKPSALIQ